MHARCSGDEDTIGPLGLGSSPGMSPRTTLRAPPTSSGANGERSSWRGRSGRTASVVNVTAARGREAAPDLRQRGRVEARLAAPCPAIRPRAGVVQACQPSRGGRRRPPGSGGAAPVVPHHHHRSKPMWRRHPAPPNGGSGDRQPLGSRRERPSRARPRSRSTGRGSLHRARRSPARSSRPAAPRRQGRSPRPPPRPRSAPSPTSTPSCLAPRVPKPIVIGSLRVRARGRGAGRSRTSCGGTRSPAAAT